MLVKAKRTDRTAAAVEALYLKDLLEVLSYPRIKAALDSAYSSVARALLIAGASVDEALSAVGSREGRMAKAIEEAHKRGFDRYGSWSVRAMGLKDDASLFRQAMDLFLARYSAEKVTMVTRTTKEIIARELLRGVQNGEGTMKLARRIREAAKLNTWRAAMIARTETQFAAQYGARSMVETLGLKPDKEWSTVLDGRERPDHAAADGQVVGFDEPFRVGSVSMLHPGDVNAPAEQVVNCRCVVLYHGA